MVDLTNLLRPDTKFTLCRKWRNFEVGCKGKVSACHSNKVNIALEAGVPGSPESRTTVWTFMTMEDFADHCSLEGTQELALAAEEGVEFVEVQPQRADGVTPKASLASSTAPKVSTTPPPPQQEDLSHIPEHILDYPIWFQVGNNAKTFWKMEDSVQKIQRQRILANAFWKEYRTSEDQPCIVVNIQPENAIWKRSHGKTVACCAFTATNEFLKFVLGGSLHSSDQTWYTNHPLTEAAGLPAAHTITLLNDLVKPWGIGVSRVWIRAAHIDWDEHHEWCKVLGCNPMAVGDQESTNEQYVQTQLNFAREAKATEEQLAEYEAQLREEVKGFRLEYVPADSLPRLPMVLCEGGYNSQYASGGGHASFSSPRMHKGSRWGIALQFDRLENCVRHAEPPTTDTGEEIQENLDLDWRQSRCGDTGKTFSSVMYNYNSGTSQATWNGGQNRGALAPKGFRPPTPNRETKSQRRKGRKERNRTLFSRHKEFDDNEHEYRDSELYPSPLFSTDPYLRAQFVANWCVEKVNIPFEEITKSSPHLLESNPDRIKVFVKGIRDLVEETPPNLVITLHQADNWKDVVTLWMKGEDDGIVDTFTNGFDELIANVEGSLTLLDICCVEELCRSFAPSEFIEWVSDYLVTYII